MIKLAQIGCGYWGPNLLRNFAALPGAKLRFVVETSGDRRNYVKASHPDIQTVAELEPVLCDPAVDAVVIATPARSHFALAARALAAGKHVFVEKPLAMTVAEVDRLDAAARTGGLTLMVGHTFLYNPAVLALKQLIDAGELGRIYYLYTQRLNLGVVRSDVNALWNLAPHDVSIANFLLGAAPAAASAHGTAYLQSGIEDVVFANFEYPGQVRASVHVSWLDPNKVRKVTLVGSRRMAVYDEMAENKLTLFDKGVDAPVAGPGEPLPFDRPPADLRLVYRSGKATTPPIADAEPLRETARDFLAAIAGRRRPRADAANGRAVVAGLEAASRSLAECSRRVEIPSA